MASLLGIITEGMVLHVRPDADRPEGWQGAEVTVVDTGDLIVGAVRIVKGAIAPQDIQGQRHNSVGVPLTCLVKDD